MLRLAVPLSLLALAACAEIPHLRAESLEPARYRLEAGQAAIQLALAVRSTAAEPMAAESVEYEVLLEGRPVAVGSVQLGGAEGVTVPAGGAASLELVLTLAWEQLPPDVASRLERGGAVPVDVRGDVVYRLPGRKRASRVRFALDAHLLPVAAAGETPPRTHQGSPSPRG